MKVKLTITIGIMLIVCAVAGLMVYCFYPAMISTINENKYYTYEQYEENYQNGFNDGVKNFQELTSQIDSYKDMINELQNENSKLTKENAIYQNFVEAYNKEGISVVSYEVDGVLLDILPVNNSVTLSTVLTTKEVPAKVGHDFVGWSLDGQTVLDPANYMVTENIVLNAVYEAKTYALTFIMNKANIKDVLDLDGEVVVYESTIKYGQTITETVLASAEEPINEYLLSISSKSWVSGWSSPEYSHYDEAGNYITTVNFEEYPIVKDTVFYAIFTCKVDDLPEKDVDLGNYF